MPVIVRFLGWCARGVIPSCAHADVVTAKEVATLAYHREIVRDCSWHPRLPLLASVSWDGTIVTWGPPRDDPITGMPEPGWDTLEDNF